MDALRGMRLAPLSVAVPLLSLTPAFTALAAIPLLGERPSPSDFTGILLVVSGAIILGRGTGKKDGLGREEEERMLGREIAVRHPPDAAVKRPSRGNPTAPENDLASTGPSPTVPLFLLLLLLLLIPGPPAQAPPG